MTRCDEILIPVGVHVARNEYDRLTVGGSCGWLRADHPPMGTLSGASGVLWVPIRQAHRGSLVVGLAGLSAGGGAIPSSPPAAQQLAGNPGYLDAELPAAAQAGPS